MFISIEMDPNALLLFSCGDVSCHRLVRFPRFPVPGSGASVSGRSKCPAFDDAIFYEYLLRLVAHQFLCILYDNQHSIYLVDSWGFPRSYLENAIDLPPDT